MTASKTTKRHQRIEALFNKAAAYSLKEALAIVKKYAVEGAAKFDEGVDVVFRLGIDPRQTDQMVRGAVPMPRGLGKEVKVAVFVRPEKVEEAKKAGADIVGSDELIEEVKNGRLDFDVCIASPDMMGKVGTLGKILGPKGKMPNPKLGTVTPDIVGAIKQVKAGQAEFKSEKAGLVHTGIGKISFDIAALQENFMALYEAVQSAKPSSSKGVYMRKAYITTTMGPSIMLDLGRMVE